ncbi:hypothetical protein ACFVGM_33125 [Kitasatospora purpeofusca]|uniref:hypothetical protein n=1 Tax=Kitasatospora purpeofusca TaxID=67352 RepID=UPI0036A223AC
MHVSSVEDADRSSSTGSPARPTAPDLAVGARRLSCGHQCGWVTLNKIAREVSGLWTFSAGELPWTAYDIVSVPIYWQIC